MTEFKISSSVRDIENHCEQLALLLHRCSPEAVNPAGTRDAALLAVTESLRDDADTISLAALIDDEVLGWIAGKRYRTHGFRITHCVVHPDVHRLGIGRRMAIAFESAAQDAGALIVHASMIDSACSTSLGGRDLFPGLLSRTVNEQDDVNHPVIFFLCCGYELAGVLPDAYGWGKPELIVAKRVG